MTLQPVRGTRDLWGDTFDKIRWIAQKAESIVRTYGFHPIETPIFEKIEVFQKTLGETSDIVGKEMYTFSDRGGDVVTLRPEGTAPLMRAYASNNLGSYHLNKFFSVGPMFRYERPQKGRYRQFYQFNVEWLKETSPYSDVETIACASHVLRELGISFQLHLNTLGDQESRKRYRECLVAFLSLHAAQLSEDSQRRLTHNPLRILDSKDEGDQSILAKAPRLFDVLTPDSQEFFEKVCQGLDVLKIPYILDPMLVRGLDYYVHTVFEFKSSQLGAQDTLLGGGRYAGLMERIHNQTDVPGIGWAMGIDRAVLALDESFQLSKPLKIALIAVESQNMAMILTLVHTLRSEQFVCEVMYAATVGKKLREADRLGCTWAIMVGDDEEKEGSITLKNLKTRDDEFKSRKVKIDEIGTVLREMMVPDLR